MLNQSVLTPTASVPAQAKPGQDELERSYLSVCQRLEELLERKKRLIEEPTDLPGLHQELDLIGSRIQRNPGDAAQEEDYLAVVRRAKECLWKRLEADQISGEFQSLHFELLGLGQRLGYQAADPTPATTPATKQRPAPTPISTTDFAEDSAETGLDAVERQIAELQNRIRGLHRG